MHCVIVVRYSCLALIFCLHPGDSSIVVQEITPVVSESTLRNTILPEALKLAKGSLLPFPCHDANACPLTGTHGWQYIQIPQMTLSQTSALLHAKLWV